MVAIIIGLISVFVAAILFVASIIAEAKNNKKASDICFLVTRIALYVSLACMVCSLLYYSIKPSAKEYPASEYELKYKIVDYDGKSDTTYVLIPLKLKEQQEKGKKAIEEERMRNKY